MKFTQLSKMLRTQTRARLFAALTLPASLILSIPSYAQTDTPSSTEQASQAEATSERVQGYIRDDLFIYMHAGSSTRFKIIGSINAATPVEKLDTNTETDYVQVKDDKGRIGWIESKSFTTATPVAILLEQAQEQIKQLQDQNLKDEAQISQLKQQLSESNKNKNTVAGMLELSETENSKLKQQVIENQSKHKLKQMMYGAGIIVIGLILGLILPHLIPRKRRGDHWV